MGFELIKDEAGIDYAGKAERCVFEFRTPPEQIPGEAWLANQIVEKGIAELRTQGSELLWIRVWRNTDPLWHTDYRVELTATASPLWWNLIIIGILAIVVLVVGWQIVSVVKDIDWGKAAAPLITGGIGLALVAVFGILLLTGGREKRRA